MEISRDRLLETLERVQFGVPPRETVSFSKCFIFRDGKVMTYDDEILCSAALPGKNGQKDAWKGITGAVEAQRLLDILRKIPEPELSLMQKKGELCIAVGKIKAYFRMEEIEGELPSDQVEKPGEWLALPENFGEAIGLVQNCAKEKDSTFSRTCVHITKDYMEAYDNFQMIRLHIKNPKITSESILVRKEAIKHIATLGMHRFSETDNWIHFKAKNGLVYSCRRWLEEYPDLSSYFAYQGREITFPKTLENMIDRANIFSQELADANRVKVDARGGKIHVTGIGVTGRLEEWDSLDGFKDAELAFMISPTLLINIVKKNLSVQLSDSTLIVDGGLEGLTWKYLAILVNPDDVDLMEELKQESEEDQEEEEEAAEYEDED